MKKKILPVPSVGFVGNTGDNRSPESLPFPSCMTSLMLHLGEDYPNIPLEAHNTGWTLRTANQQFLTASGMAFGLLWDDNLCPSSMDLMQIESHEDAIRRGFRWAGYTYEAIDRTDDNEESLRARLVKSIDAGMPVLAFGLLDIPECLILTGYDDDGKTVLGWSHFQKFVDCEKEPNGMFRRDNWHAELWSMVFPCEKIGRSLTIDEVIRHGIKLMQKETSEGYLCGDAAYRRWIDRINACADSDDEQLKNFYEYHHNILFSLAELRCWGGSFLRETKAVEAGEHFQAIHDLCWQADAVIGGKGFEALKGEGVRARLIEKMNEIRAQDAQALAALTALSL